MCTGLIPKMPMALSTRVQTRALQCPDARWGRRRGGTARGTPAQAKWPWVSFMSRLLTLSIAPLLLPVPAQPWLGPFEGGPHTLR